MRASSGLFVLGVLLACSRAAPIGPKPVSDVGPGPAVGQAVPSFEAPDQHGQRQTLASLRGPSGLYLNFNRSVVW